MSETHDLTQRAEEMEYRFRRLHEDPYSGGIELPTANLIRELLAALVQAEQREAKAVALVESSFKSGWAQAEMFGANEATTRKLEAAEARLATQEAAIRQVVAAMRTAATDFPETVTAGDLLSYADLIEAAAVTERGSNEYPVAVASVPDPDPRR